jgi:tRNA(adenine34) deaminase
VVIDGRIISRGRARHKELRNQLRHAERNALLDGGEPLWKDYDRAILFTNVEPCPLCLGAVVMANVPHVVFAREDKVVYSPQTIEANPYVRRHLRAVITAACWPTSRPRSSDVTRPPCCATSRPAGARRHR